MSFILDIVRFLVFLKSLWWVCFFIISIFFIDIWSIKGFFYLVGIVVFLFFYLFYIGRFCFIVCFIFVVEDFVYLNIFKIYFIVIFSKEFSDKFANYLILVFKIEGELF